MKWANVLVLCVFLVVGAFAATEVVGQVGPEFTVVPSGATTVAASDGIVTWVDTTSQNLSKMDLQTGGSATFYTNLGSYPVRSLMAGGSTAAWLEDHGGEYGYWIRAQDTTGSELIKISSPDPVNRNILNSRPQVSGNSVVWAQAVLSNPDLNLWTQSILSYDLPTRTQSTLFTGKCSLPSVSGNWLTWVDGRNISTTGPDIYAKNSVTGEEVAVSTAPGSQQNPVIRGTIVAWQDANSSIRAKDLSIPNCEEEILFAGTTVSDPVLGNGYLAWNDKRSGDFDPYAKSMAGVVFHSLPSGASNNEDFPLAMGFAGSPGSQGEFPLSIATGDQFGVTMGDDYAVWLDPNLTPPSGGALGFAMAGSDGNAIRGVHFVPEPGTIALLALPCLLLAYRVLRRKKN